MRHSRTIATTAAFGAVLLAGGVAWAQTAETPAPNPDTVNAPSPNTMPDQAAPNAATPAPNPDMTGVPSPSPNCGPCVADEPTYTYVQPAPAQKKRANRWFAPSQVSLVGGGGVSDFVGSSLRNATETGAAWDARLTVGSRSFFAFEAGYIGTYNKLESFAEGPNTAAPYLSSNGIDTDLRLNLIPWRVEPYIYAGVGYNHMQLNNRGEDLNLAARFRHTDEQLTVPAGAGLAGYIGDHATVDARFTYRKIFDQGIDMADPSAIADQWMVSGRVGYQF